MAMHLRYSTHRHQVGSGMFKYPSPGGHLAYRALDRLLVHAVRKHGIAHPHVRLLTRYIRMILDHKPDYTIFQDMRVAGMLQGNSPRNLADKARMVAMGFLP